MCVLGNELDRKLYPATSALTIWQSTTTQKAMDRRVSSGPAVDASSRDMGAVFVMEKLELSAAGIFLREGVKHPAMPLNVAMPVSYDAAMNNARGLIASIHSLSRLGGNGHAAI